MARLTEEYKLVVLWQGKRYAALAHSIEKDESLYVRSRKKGRSSDVKSGRLVSNSNNELSVDESTKTVPAGQELHYHPSGRVLRKNEGVTVKQDQFPPLLELQSVIPLIRFSPPTIEWLDEAKKTKEDIEMDLSQIANFYRLEFLICVGPKNCFLDEKNRPSNTYMQLVWGEAFYDVAYFVREMDPLDENLKLRAITAFPETDYEPSEQDKKTPAPAWAGALVINRQIRTFMEEFNELNKARPPQDEHKEKWPSDAPGLFSSSYFLRMSICRDGIVGAVGAIPNSSPGEGGCEYNFFDLPSEKVLEMLIHPQNAAGSFFDVAAFDKKIPEKTLFLKRSHGLTGSMQHEMVLLGNTVGKVPYYQLPIEFIQRTRLVREVWIREII